MSFFASEYIPGVLSIDRITFLVFSPRLSLWSENHHELRSNMHNIEKFSSLINLRLSSILDPDFPQGASTPLYKRHYRTIGGVDLQFGPFFPVRTKKKNLDQNSEEEYIYQPAYYCFRIEYNPNKTNLTEIKPLFNNFKSFSIDKTVILSRIDVAIDYIVSINPELILCRGVKKNCVFGGMKGVETVYFGRRTSRNLFRIYNKRQEIIDSGDPDPQRDIWRVELEHSNNYPLSQTPDLSSVFDKLTFLPGCVLESSDEDWILQILLENALHNGSLQNTLNKLPRTTRNRYLDKLRLYYAKSRFLEDPALIFRRDFGESFSRIRSQIIELFGKAVFL